MNKYILKQLISLDNIDEEFNKGAYSIRYLYTGYDLRNLSIINDKFITDPYDIFIYEFNNSYDVFIYIANKFWIIHHHYNNGYIIDRSKSFIKQYRSYHKDEIKKYKEFKNIFKNYIEQKIIHKNKNKKLTTNTINNISNNNVYIGYAATQLGTNNICIGYT